MYPGVYKQRERNEDGVPVFVGTLLLLLLFPRTLCYRTPYYVFPTFSSVFCCFFPLSLRKKCRIFCAALLGGGLGVWGFGGWGFGWGGFRGGVGGGIIAFVCVCAVVSPFPFFLITVVSVFFSLRQDVNFFVWRVWFCYCPCCLDRVRDLWFLGGWVLRDLGLCVLYMI